MKCKTCNQEIKNEKTATTVSYGTTYAWYTFLSYGYTTTSDKATGTSYVRCCKEK
jgi:hypothetical protein